jgi:hypothetical protein
MKALAMRSVFSCLLTLIALLIGSASAQDTSFRRVQLAHGISLEIPSHWKVLSLETRLNLGAASEAITRNAGAKALSGKNEGLLAVNATPEPPGAKIRVSVTTPAEYSQAELAAVTTTELNQLQPELYVLFTKLEASGGAKVLGVETPRIERFNNQLALVIPYTRADVVGATPWQVTQYKVPLGPRLMEITLSHRQSDAIVWKPILEAVKRSVRF